MYSLSWFRAAPPPHIASPSAAHPTFAPSVTSSVTSDSEDDLDAKPAPTSSFPCAALPASSSSSSLSGGGGDGVASAAPWLAPHRCFSCAAAIDPGSSSADVVTDATRHWHRACFRCSTCAAPLSRNPGTFFVYNDGVFCHKHRPLLYTVVADRDAAPEDGRDQLSVLANDTLFDVTELDDTWVRGWVERTGEFGIIPRDLLVRQEHT